MKTVWLLDNGPVPAGATQERTQKVLDEVTITIRNKEKANVESVFAVNGFGFAGRVRIPVLHSCRWRLGRSSVRKKNKVEVITQRATAAFSQIKDAMVRL